MDGQKVFIWTRRNLTRTQAGEIMKTIMIIALMVLGACIICTPAIADYSYRTETGSSFYGTGLDGSKGSFFSELGSRIIGDAGTGTGTQYKAQINSASGYANSFIRGTMMEGRSSNNNPSSIISFSQSTSARGQIFGFSVSYQYGSHQNPF